MTYFRTSIIAICLFVAGNALQHPVSAAGFPHKGGEDPMALPVSEIAGPVIAPPVVVVVKKPIKIKKKVVVKHKKRVKKTAKRQQVTVQAVSPGVKLTVNQVMEILNTTRDLSGKNLGGLQLVGMNLSRCNLKGSDLSHANLERADLGESGLDRVNLSGANLKMANLRLAGMPAANLDMAVLDGAIWLDGRICAKGSYGQCREFTAPDPLKQTTPPSIVQVPSGNRP